jgi:hypothetical protein
MTKRKSELRQKEFRTIEEIEKEKERIRKQQQTRNKSDADDYEAYEFNDDPLLDALIANHPERDPAKIK